MTGIHRTHIRLGNISTSDTEIIDLLKAWLVLSAAFAILLSGSPFAKGFYTGFLISSLTVGTGFLLHELAHKIVAQRYGCFAEFRSFDFMLLVALAMSFAGFLFAAPGAVMISGHVDKRKNGIISVAGPIVNVVLALGFLLLGFLFSGNLGLIALYGFRINGFLALFNMIPALNFDGAKVLSWNKMWYGIVTGVSGLLVIVAYIM